MLPLQGSFRLMLEDLHTKQGSGQCYCLEDTDMNLKLEKRMAYNLLMVPIV